MRAAEQAAKELDGLTGEPLCRQSARVQELIAKANQLNAACYEKHPDIPPSMILGSVARGVDKSQNQASSPVPSRVRERSGDNGKTKQLQRYDPVFAGKQLAARRGAGRGDAGQGS